MGRSGGKNRIKVSARTNISRARGIPPKEVSDAEAHIGNLIKDLDVIEDGGISIWRLEKLLAQKLVMDAVDTLYEPGGFVRGQAILTAISPDIRGSDLAMAMTSRGSVIDYLQDNGIRLIRTGYDEIELGTDTTERAVAAGLGLEIDSAVNLPGRQRERVYQYLSSGLIKDGKLIPREDKILVEIDNKKTEIAILNRFNQKGDVSTRIRSEVKVLERRWDEKKEKWVEVADGEEEVWKLDISFTEEGEVKGTITSNGPAHQEEIKELAPSAEEIQEAGSPLQWFENKLEESLREDREWEEKNPKKARKRRKQNEKRKKLNKKREKEAERKREEERREEIERIKAARDRVGRVNYLP